MPYRCTPRHLYLRLSACCFGAVPAPKQHADYRPTSITPIMSRLMERTVVRTFLYPTFLDLSAVVVSRLTYVSTAWRGFVTASNIQRVDAADSVAVSARRTHQTSASIWRSATTDFSIESATTRNVVRSLLPPSSATSQISDLRPPGPEREGEEGKDVHHHPSSPARGLGSAVSYPPVE